MWQNTALASFNNSPMKCVGDKMVQNCYAELHKSQTNQKVCDN